jgi:mono/diheme cytochrome c family protein
MGIGETIQMQMSKNKVASFLLTAIVVSCAVPALATEHDVRQPRVPADKLAEARDMTNPLPDSPEILRKGKAVYNGKGTCFNCHGRDGDGHGPVASQLNPSPRNFHHHVLWQNRTEGELFWVIKHGSPGTAMIGFGRVLSDDEIWAVVRYLRGFARERGRDRTDQGQSMGPMKGRHGGMGGMGHGGPMMGKHGMMGGMKHGEPKSETSGCEDKGCGQ